MDIQPITNEEEHSKALLKIEELIHAEDGTDEAYTLDALLTLIEAYEQKTWPLDFPFDPIGLLHQAMTPEVGHSRKELIKIVGSAPRVSEILAKKRALTLEAIRAISDAWGIPIALLTRKYDLAVPVRSTGSRKPLRARKQPNQHKKMVEA